ncbi:MAG TPA: response regulator transcription factor [Candidatus Kryptonia bacterium]
MERLILKFLIVDDNKTFRETLTRFVKLDGDEVIECEDGNEAPEAYLLHRPDWVLMDIHMKDVGGIQATAGIIAVDPQAKVVIVTDYGDKFFRRAAEKAGAVGFVVKDELSELQLIVRRAK